MDTLEVLQQARDILAESPWIQGQGHMALPSGRIGYCAVGAVSAAIQPEQRDWHRVATGTFTPTDDHDIALIHAAVEELGPYVEGHNVPGYNDAPERTKQEMLDLFDQAIRHEQIRRQAIADAEEVEERELVPA